MCLCVKGEWWYYIIQDKGHEPAYTLRRKKCLLQIEISCRSRKQCSFLYLKNDFVLEEIRYELWDQQASLVWSSVTSWSTLYILEQSSTRPIPHKLIGQTLYGGYLHICYWMTIPDTGSSLFLVSNLWRKGPSYLLYQPKLLMIATALSDACVINPNRPICLEAAIAL